MMILIVLSVLIVVGLILMDSSSAAADVAGTFVVLFGVLGLIICAATIPLQRMSYYDFEAQVEAMREYAEASRATGNRLEGAAWRAKAAEVNAKIASMQYWNGTVLDIWYPDAVDSLEPLK